MIFKNKVSELGRMYLSEGKTLLHGDYYPGSWIKAKDNLKIIDPEFSFVGNKEFELGIFIAHLKMIETVAEQIETVILKYNAGAHFNWGLCYQFAGIEIMRRIIGLAQLPFDLTLEEKESLLKEAHTYIIK
jgi:5-methylthioribose kinase